MLLHHQGLLLRSGLPRLILIHLLRLVVSLGITLAPLVYYLNTE